MQKNEQKFDIPNLKIQIDLNLPIRFGKLGFIVLITKFWSVTKKGVHEKQTINNGAMK